ncbi:hypothetical protein [Gluconobacter aidae]|nr:hypothetical protein [Gluconobacter aidae]
MSLRRRMTESAACGKRAISHPGVLRLHGIGKGGFRDVCAMFLTGSDAV